jgi:hypothetical protein
MVSLVNSEVGREFEILKSNQSRKLDDPNKDANKE